MHDMKAIRSAPIEFEAAMARRGQAAIIGDLLGKDVSVRQLKAQLQSLQERRRLNSAEHQRSLSLGEQGSISEEFRAAHLGVTEAGSRLRLEISELEMRLRSSEAELRGLLSSLPNILDAEVPDGPDETANVVLRQLGEPPAFAFKPREHFELGEALGMMDFATAAKISGSRFTILRGGLARLERALGQFMIDLHTTEHGYEETAVPLLVNDEAVFGTNQLPKFAEDLFHTDDGRWLIPTAEVPLTNMAAREILSEARLPIRVAALSDCFRSEAGSAGRDTRGMLRQHQFRKVELVSITRPEDSDAEHERMTRCAETVLERLELAYRRVLLCSGDTGFGAASTHDLEVWLPGQGAWREISSCSNMRAFQARRMEARYRPADGRAVAHVNTLNGSGVAVGRALVAIMENCQQQDGSIEVPAVLRPYLSGVARICR